MLKRKMYENLLKWKSSKRQECLLIKGARQVGKTYIVREFGYREYKHFVELNFLENPAYKEIFAKALSADEIYKRMSAYIPNISLEAGNTLIFLDEIQKCAAARTALKFLAIDGRYDVIASGSLLGLHYGQDDDPENEEIESIPVGYEKSIVMYSLDFEEFLWAYGYGQDAISEIKDYYTNREKVPSVINDKFLSLIKEYITVGGMPEAVAQFTKSKDFNEVQEIQEKILAAYDDDIANHAKGAEKVKVRACFHSVPRQLARENKKFKYSEVEHKATSRKYWDSIQWLQDSSIVNVAYNVYEPQVPLMANSNDSEFKLYMNDIGLLMALYGSQAKLMVFNNTIKGNAKGGIYENLIADMLVKRGYPLYYYKRTDSTMEIEFLIEAAEGITPIEVKAGNGDTPSLNHFIESFEPKTAIKLIDGNVGNSNGKLTLPHYMAMFL